MDSIHIQNVTKDYGNHKGIFDISMTIKQGEVYGYLGPNGAGKSTTMRHLMGFCKADKGIVEIQGMDCRTKQQDIQKVLGYLPGEIAFPNDMSGKKYLKMIADMRHMKDMEYAYELLKLFEIDPKADLKRMSKGMKQKIGIVSAFMHDPQIILLDEPTSGLDPLMQNRFLELVENEKKKGKTILMSSHLFEEVEKTCDRIGIIKNGSIIQEVTAQELKHSRLKSYKMEFYEEKDIETLKVLYPNAECDKTKKQMIISVTDNTINELVQHLSNCKLVYLKEEKHTLEDYFMKYYGGDSQ